MWVYKTLWEGRSQGFEHASPILSIMLGGALHQMEQTLKENGTLNQHALAS